MLESILTLAIAICGIAYMIGAKDFAIGLLKKVGIVVVALAFLPCLARSCGDSNTAGSGFDPNLPPWTLIVVGLAGLGFAAWKTRATRHKAHDAWRKKHLHPRKRALPLPPPTEEDQ
jgi:hypothetical protein